jgi:hypothetical protein
MRNRRKLVYNCDMAAQSFAVGTSTGNFAADC